MSLNNQGGYSVEVVMNLAKRQRTKLFIGLYVLFVVVLILAIRAHGKDMKYVVVGYKDGTQDSLPGSPELTAALVPFFPALEAPTTQPGTTIVRGTPGMQFQLDSAGFVLAPIASNAVQVFVATTGKDTNPGTASSPVQTISGAVKKAQPGKQLVVNFNGPGIYSSPLDQLPSGVKDTPTIVRTNPQSTQRAIISPYKSNGIAWLGGKHDLMILDLAFIAARRGPNDPQADYNYQTSGLYFLDCSRVWVEGNLIEYFTDNLVAQASQTKRISDVVIRRNVNAYNFSRDQGRHSQGCFFDRVDGLLIEDNYGLHNGWAEFASAVDTQFNHGVYTSGECTNVATRNNYFWNASSHGCQARSGGPLERNIADTCAIGFSYGLVNGSGKPTTGGTQGQITRNVVFSTKAIHGQARGIGFQFGNIQQASIVSNVATQNPSPWGVSYAYSFEHPEGTFQSSSVGVRHVSMTDNVSWKWTPSLYVEPALKATGKGEYALTDVQLKNNLLPQMLNEQDMIINQPMPTNFQDPNRTPDLYVSSIGLHGHFQDLVLTQQRRGWDTRLTAANLGQFIIDGFKQKP